jgi:hypothetical protein
MAMPSHLVVPSFFMNDHVRTIREDGWERTFDLNPDGHQPFRVIVTVWPELQRTVLQAKASSGEVLSIELAYTDSEFNLLYDQLHCNWYALLGMITAGVIQSL